MLLPSTSGLLLLDVCEPAGTNPFHTFGAMPYHDEEYPGQPLWQSVLLFCCKGMIEGIMVTLFFWLLVQVLFTKQLEVHLQILLLVGLIIFCLTLILGCIICWKKSLICSGEDKASVTSAEASGEHVISAQGLHSSGTTTASRQLDGDTLEYPSAFTSLAPSQDEFLPRQFDDQAQANCEENEQATSYFSLRRFSSPLQTTPLYKPIHPSRASLPSMPKPGLSIKTCKALERRCTVAGDNRSCNEHSRLTRHVSNTTVMPENVIPLVPLNYGSNANFKQPFSSKPCLHFTMAFSPEQQTLAVTILNLTGVPQRLKDVTVLGSLPPLHTCPTPATFRSHESDSLTLIVSVSSVQELQSCELRLFVYKQSSQSSKGTAMGEVEVNCGGRAWRLEHPFHLIQELAPNSLNVEESLQSWSSQDALLLIGLQYQALNHCIRASILKAENLDTLPHTPSSSSSSAADYQVVINLHHEGVLISSRETPRESCTVCNASFLFDIPPGDISQLPILLEFVIVQSRAFAEGQAVGRVLLGAEAGGAGRAHWRDMCSLQELARWHIVQPDTL